jgi:hypothetical protein
MERHFEARLRMAAAARYDALTAPIGQARTGTGFCMQYVASSSGSCSPFMAVSFLAVVSVWPL